MDTLAVPLAHAAFLSSSLATTYRRSLHIGMSLSSRRLDWSTNCRCSSRWSTKCCSGRRWTRTCAREAAALVHQLSPIHIKLRDGVCVPRPALSSHRCPRSDPVLSGLRVADKEVIAAIRGVACEIVAWKLVRVLVLHQITPNKMYK